MSENDEILLKHEKSSPYSLYKIRPKDHEGTSLEWQGVYSENQTYGPI